MAEVNKQGQALGRKGSESRARLLAAALALIADGAADRLSVTAVARTAGLASQTFYLYFADVDELLLHLSREAAREVEDILAVLERPWERAALTEQAASFVGAFYRYWERNRAILTIRNFRADAGHAAFLAIRNDSTMPVVAALAERIRAAQDRHTLSERDALARAIVIIAAIDRMASRYSALQGSAEGLDSLDLKRAEAHILLLMLSRLPP